MPMPLNDRLLEATLREWERWVYEVEGAGNDTPEALKALDESRAALLDVLIEARKLITGNAPELDRVRLIHDELANAFNKLYNIEGNTSGRIQSSEPNFNKAETDRVRCEAGGPLPLDPSFTEQEKAMKVPHHCELGCTIMPTDHLPEGSF